MRVINSTDKTNTIFIWGLFLLTPFISLIVSIKNIRSPWSKNIIWAFTMFFGFTFTLTDDTAESDINRYIDWFHIMRNSGMDFEQFKSLLYVDKDYADLLQPSLTFMLAQFTDNQAYLLAAFGLIFGYFYSRNIWYVIERLKPEIDSRILFLLVVFAFVVPIWQINGFRFWTATHVFLFGAMPLIYDKKKLYIIPVILTVFIHFSFTVPIVLLLLYLIIGNRPHIYFYTFILSMFITELNLDSLNSTISGFLPDIFVTRSSGYISEDKVEALATTTISKNWYASFYLDALRWAVVALLIYIYIKGRSIWKNNKKLYVLFSFVLFFYTAANVLNVIPSGNRFTHLANLFALALIIFYLNTAEKDLAFNKIFKFSLPLQLLFLIVTVRSAFSFLGMVTIAGNPISAFFVPSEITLIDLIK